MKSHTPGPGLPMAKNSKRSTHASMAMSITRFMPKRRRQNGISNMHSASLTCDSEVSRVALLAPKVEAYCSTPLKEVINVVAKPLVICRATPSNIEKTKNRAMRRSANSLNAERPRVSATLRPCAALRSTGLTGRVNANTPRISPSTAEASSCISVYWKR